MTETNPLDSAEQIRKDNEKSDAIAALVVLVIAVLAAINFVYTGGLPAFFAHVL